MKNPFYFTLQYSQNLYTSFNMGKTIAVKLHNIAYTDVSFTFNDSMTKLYSSDWEKPFLKNQLYDCIAANDNCIEKFLCSIQPRYL